MWELAVPFLGYEVRDMLPCYRWSDCGCLPCQNEGGLYEKCPKDIIQRVKALGIEGK